MAKKKAAKAGKKSHRKSPSRNSVAQQLKVAKAEVQARKPSKSQEKRHAVQDEPELDGLDYAEPVDCDEPVCELDEADFYGDN